VLVVGAFATIAVLGGFDWKSANTSTARFALVTGRPARTIATLAVLIVAAQPAIEGAAPESVQAALRSLRTTGLNAHDLAMQHRGYYEQLDVRAQLDAPVAFGGARQTDWQDLSQLGVLNDRDDLMLRDLLPSRHTTWNGNAFTTNSWGMRDREYEKTKPAGTFRIAILGPSHVMGNGVADNETFENLVEQRLNQTLVPGRYNRVEFLNFGVDGYSLPQQLALLEDRVFAFSPDLVIATHYKDNITMTEGLLQKIVERGIPVQDPALAELMKEAGLDHPSTRGTPIPYEFARHAAGWFGIETRMPFPELRTRVHRISDDVLRASFKQFSDTTRAHGVSAAVLALNVVIDDVPREVPLRDAIAADGLPIFDLFDVFPVERRPSLRVAPWDDHPNAQGHALIADRLFQELNAFLTSRDRAVERSSR
jgi:hypothetical protein